MALNQVSFQADSSGNTRMSHFNQDGKLTTQLFPGANTLHEILRRGAQVSNNGRCLGYRHPPVRKSTPYTWLTYDEVIRKSEMFAQGLVPAFCQPGQQTYIGIYAQNRPEWIIVEQACYVYSMLSVPIYNTFSIESVRSVLIETALPVIVIDTLDKLEILLKIRNESESLKLVVLMDDIIHHKPSLKAEAESLNITLKSMKEVLAMGQNNKQAVAFLPPKPSSLAAISYTSGTGGTARGVLLSHSNYAASASAVSGYKHILFTTNDILFSFLPAAHSFERMMEAMALASGGAIGFFQGNVLLLGDDLFHLRPTIMPCVPSLLNRVHNNAMFHINQSTLSQWLFKKGLAAKKELLERHIVCDDTIWDYLIFGKIRKYFGGRIRNIVCGSAPCSAEILTFMRIAVGCFIVEGYGCTENTGGACCTLEGDFETGHVGPPCSSNKIKLIQVPEMTNMGISKAGEVCIFGPTVFQGYFKDPEMSAKVIDKEGWLHTGDIGMWTEQGTLKIIGRKNCLFKLPQGEFISPEKIENVYAHSQFIFQIYVYGDNYHDYIVGIVIPDFHNLKVALKPLLGPKSPSIFEICTHEASMTLILHDMQEKAKEAGLTHVERVEKITLHPEPFSVENGLITPTMKLKRMALSKRFGSVIDTMYGKK